ncbi:hypothetical protein PPL_06609 [Heterostelium album PN500]|uniref:MYND-type domain-containing protein n=1 Tax=Heterostelium pallidum (strain ATCC 26659 / Pp 5 / PN500) TaxID=670386 RepID=D3BF76_HETP5|nr:hypothetical protein PPL_06609 [Heterostelium album PN500]EFA79790.1 hypothetical protein PPL_06609 [Heterostelium album PN500]|eukprot:XP_020431911.1 hypothetical protein PPL_06609 [Heterostelium album PN500]
MKIKNTNVKDQTKNIVIEQKVTDVSKSVIIAGLSVSRSYMSSMFGHHYFVLSGGNVWCDTPDSIVKLKSLIPINLNDLSKVYQSALLSGDRSTWEIPVFSFLLQPICQKLGGQAQSQKLIASDIQFISGITDLFNHYTSSGAVFDSTELNDDFDDLTKLLLSVGSNKQEIQSLLSLNVEQNKHSEKKSSILKKNIKEQMNNHNYLEAIKLANEGTNIYGLSVDTLAKFYFYAGYSQEMQRFKTQSNAPRDDVLLNLSRMKSIKPNWKCTLFLTAVILHNDEKLEEARKSIEMCLSMSPQYRRARSQYEMIKFDVDFGHTYSDEDDVTDPIQFAMMMRNKDPNLVKGFTYYYGVNTKKDYIKALEYFQKFPNSGDMVMYCGMIYQFRTAYRDFKKAFECFKRANDLGHAEGPVYISTCYLYGYGVPLDHKQAIVYLEQAVRLGHSESMNVLAGPPQPKKSAQLFLRAASLRPEPNPLAMYNLAGLYLNGFGIDKDLDAANMWLKRAMQYGVDDSKNLKGKIQAARASTNLPPQFRNIFQNMSNDTSKEVPRETKLVSIDQMESYVSKSKVAAMMLNGRKLYREAAAMIMAGKSKPKDIISKISKSYQMHEIMVDDDVLREIFLPTLNQYLKDNPMDLDARYCLIYLKYMNDFKLILSYTQQTLKDFPNSHLIWNLASFIFGKGGKWNDAIGCNLKARELMANEKIEIQPSMHFYVGFYKIEKQRETIPYGTPLKNMDELTDIFEFQRICEKDDILRPRSYYELSSYMLFRNDMDQAYKYYRMGKESEKDQLPCFLPYNDNKPELSMFDAYEDPESTKLSNSIPLVNSDKNDNNNNELDKKTDSIIFDNDQRIRLTTHLRVCFANYSSDKNNNNNNVNQSITIKQVQNNLISKYREITTREFKIKSECVFRGSFIRGIIIERPFRNNKATHFLMVDFHGSVINVGIYDDTINNQATVDRLFFVGQNIFIVNPYHRIGTIGIDRVSMIRVDQLSELYTNNISKPNEYCNVCLKKIESKPIKCSKCNFAIYCSQECQTLDNALQHKSICF